MYDVNLIKRIEESANELLSELGLTSITVGNNQVYEINGSYMKFSYVAGLGCFVIEYAENLSAAKKNLYEDSDLFPITLGETVLLDELRKTLNEHYLK